jgi:integrase
MKVRRRVNKSGTVSWQADFGERGGRRVQKSFKTEKLALAALRDHESAMKRYGEMGRHFDAVEMAEFVMLKARVEAVGASLVDAVEFFIARGAKVTKPVLTASAIQMFHDDLKLRRRSARTLATLRCALRGFALMHERVPVHELLPAHVEGWLAANGWSARTQRGYLGHLRTWLSWCRRRGHAKEDCTASLQLGAEDVAEIGVLTVAECKALLLAAVSEGRERSLTGYVAMGMFCGLRRAELERLRWPAVNLEEKTVVVDAAKSKTRQRRVVDISDNAVCWLRLDPACGTEARMVPADFKERWQKVREKAGVKHWPNNALRHTFASMHYAQQQNEHLLQVQMGHESARMLHRHYRALVTRAEAAQFWGLVP